MSGDLRESPARCDCFVGLYVSSGAALHYTTLHYITIHYITLHYITLHYITLHYITLNYFTLHYITLHTITLHYICLVSLFPQKIYQPRDGQPSRVSKICNHAITRLCKIFENPHKFWTNDLETGKNGTSLINW